MAILDFTASKFFNPTRPSTGQNECVYETGDVADELAAVLISVHAKGAHTSPAADGTSTQTARIKKVRRPTISSAGTSEEWSYFMTRWTDYAEARKVQGKDKVIQLLECCEEQLRKDLTRNAGGSLTNKTEKEVLEAIKKLTVREEMVARVQLHNMRQDGDETIRNFCARLSSQAGVCKFLIKCPDCKKDVNFTENVL